MGRLENKDYWDQLGGRYSLGWATPSQRALSRNETDFVVRHLPAGSGKAVLDIGIGNGRILETLLAQPGVDEVSGIDVAPSMLAVCRDRLGGNPKVKRLVQCDVSSEPLPIDEPLQFISSIRVLKYMPNWRDVVRGKLIPQLTPGGVLVFSMTNQTSIKRLSRDYAVNYDQTTEGELRRGMAEAGVEVLEITGFNKLPDLLHRHSTKKWSSRLLIASEKSMSRWLGGARFATELFIAVRRP
jgi:SAM-dependent methyltransferase